MGAPIAALFTHRRRPARGNLVALVCRPGRAPRRPGLHAGAPRRARGPKIAAMRPAIIYSFLLSQPDSRQRCSRSAPLGAYNLHGSLLPTYRGRAPVNWMLVNGEREAGVTLHHMVARADAGDIVGPARGRDRRQRHGADAVSQAGAAGRRADHRAASADRRRARAAPHAGSCARQLLRAPPARGRADRLAMAGAAHLQPGARRDASLSRAHSASSAGASSSYGKRGSRAEDGTARRAGRDRVARRATARSKSRRARAALIVSGRSSRAARKALRREALVRDGSRGADTVRCDWN